MEKSITRPKTKYLASLLMLYSFIYACSNWYDPRLINIFGLNSGGGILTFPFTFLLSDLITEVYGYQQARIAIWTGFFFNLIFIAYAQIIAHLPAPPNATHSILFNQIINNNIRVILASIISYFCSEPINAYIVAKSKMMLQGRYMGLRFLSSTITASGIDSVIFSILGFYGTIPNSKLLQFILSAWILKSLIELIGLPISIRLASKLKQIEGLDIYDEDTNFSLFSLRSKYSPENNQYHE